MTQSSKDITNKDVKNKNPIKKNNLINSAVSPLLVITAISSMAAIGLGLYNTNQSLNLSRDLDTQNIKNRAMTVKILSDFEQNILNKQNILSQQLEQNIKLQQEKISLVNKEILTITKKNRGDDQTWKLQKAAYLISMAQLTLNWDKTTLPAISLLQSADLLVKSLNNPQFIGVRQSINNEVTSLEAVRQIDTTGILAKLGSLSLAIEKLPLKKAIKKQTNNVKNKELDKTQSKWQQVLDKSLAKLSSVIIIRRHNINFKPLISKQDKQLIIRQLQLSLKQAQWALIHHQQQVYKFNLTQIDSSLNEYFDLNATATKAVMTSIIDLNEQNISPTLPNINRSYLQIMEIINLQNNNNPEKV